MSASEHDASYDRMPVVAGQFYPGVPEVLIQELRACLANVEEKAEAPTLLAMAPHAGWVYSGAVAGATIGRANLAPTVILLGPNHTGMGKPLAVWPRGRWFFPGGWLNVDEELAALLIEREPLFQDDRAAHLREHSLEVLAPFLAAVNPEMTIVPIAVSQPDVETLLAVGKTVGRLLRAFERPVSLVVSSDMSHFVSQDEAQELDGRALDPALALNPALFHQTVRQGGISMCGVLPMTLALAAAIELGAQHTEITGYATSGEVNGDFSRVVGYAGMLVS